MTEVEFFFATALQKFSGTHPVSYPIGNEILFLGVKPPELEANHSSLSTGPGAYLKDDCRFDATQNYLGHE
jgi:hypothetical protein